MFDSKLDDRFKQSMMYDSMYGSGKMGGTGGAGPGSGFGQDNMVDSLRMNKAAKSKFKDSSYRRSW